MRPGNFLPRGAGDMSGAKRRTEGAAGREPQRLRFLVSARRVTPGGLTPSAPSVVFASLTRHLPGSAGEERVAHG